MSNDVFPTLIGQGWSVIKKPMFSTHKAEHVSGREVRVSNYQNPLYNFELTFPYLDAATSQDLQTLMAFFMNRRGGWDTFLYNPPDETQTYTQRTLGTGDGVEDTFIFTKSTGSFSEPVSYVYTSTPAVTVWFTVGSVTTQQLTGWSVVAPNKLVFTTPPAVGTIVKASYKWAYRVRFNEDMQDYDNFMQYIWQLKKLSFRTVKP